MIQQSYLDRYKDLHRHIHYFRQLPMISSLSVTYEHNYRISTEYQQSNLFSIYNKQNGV